MVSSTVWVVTFGMSATPRPSRTRTPVEARCTAAIDTDATTPRCSGFCCLASGAIGMRSTRKRSLASTLSSPCSGSWHAPRARKGVCSRRRIQLLQRDVRRRERSSFSCQSRPEASGHAAFLHLLHPHAQRHTFRDARVKTELHLNRPWLRFTAAEPATENPPQTECESRGTGAWRSGVPCRPRRCSSRWPKGPGRERCCPWGRRSRC